MTGSVFYLLHEFLMFMWFKLIKNFFFQIWAYPTVVNTFEHFSSAVIWVLPWWIFGLFQLGFNSTFSSTVNNHRYAKGLLSFSFLIFSLKMYKTISQTDFDLFDDTVFSATVYVLKQNMTHNFLVTLNCLEKNM